MLTQTPGRSLSVSVIRKYYHRLPILPLYFMINQNLHYLLSAIPLLKGLILLRGDIRSRPFAVECTADVGMSPFCNGIEPRAGYLAAQS